MNKTEEWRDPNFPEEDEPTWYSWDVCMMLPVPMRVTPAWDLLQEILEPHGIVLRVMGASGLEGPGPSMRLGEMTPERYAELSRIPLAMEPFEGFVKSEPKGSEA